MFLSVMAGTPAPGVFQIYAKIRFFALTGKLNPEKVCRRVLFFSS